MPSTTAKKEEDSGFNAPSVKKSENELVTIQNQWKRVWLLQQDVEQIKAGDFSCGTFWPFGLFPVLRFALVELDLVAIA